MNMITTAKHTTSNSFIINMKNIYKLLAFLTFIFGMSINQIYAQNISFNRTGAAPDPSAMLDVNDTLGGVLIPRMTLVQRNNITSPAVGLLIYQTDNTPGFYYYSGSAWTAISSTPATSNLAQVLGEGNDANNDTIYNLNVLRMGQSSAVSDEVLTVKSNNQAWGLLNTTGDVGIGFWLYDSISATDKGAGQLGTYSNHKLDFFTNNSQASMTISTDGNVGIGQATDIDNKFLVNSNTTNTTGSYVGTKVKSAGTSTSGAEQIGFYSEILGGDGTNVGGLITAENASAGFNRGLIVRGSNANENYGIEIEANSSGSNTGNAAIIATTNGQGTSYNYGMYSRALGNHSGANSGIYARADSANTNTGITGEATATPAGNNFAIGVRGLAVSTSDAINYGVYGQASSSSYINRGVVGVLNGTVTTNDAALYGIANGTGKNISVYGRSASVNSGGTNYGIYARALNADTNYAAYFEAGNVYINDKLGLGVNVPTTQFQIGPGNDVNLNSGAGMMMLGYESGQNMIFDQNEIQARTGLAAGQLLLQPEGGEVQINGAIGNNNNFMFTGGKMGIGNYSPTRSIDVIHSSAIAAMKLSGAGDTWSYSGIELGNTADSKQWNIYHRKFTGEENALMFQYFDGTNYSTRLYIDDNGAIRFNDAFTFPTSDGTSGQILSTDGSGNLSWANSSSGADNLGNHTLSQNLETNNKYISNDGDDEGIYVYNNGNVGFGINLPREQVDVNGKMIVRTSNLTGYPIIGSGYLFMAYDSTNNTALISSLNTPSTTPLSVVANNMTFRTGTNWNYASNPVVMHMDVSGNVGIGTSSPAYKLDVNGTFNANSINVNGAYTFPSVDGTSGQVLTTNGSGTVSWATPASGAAEDSTRITDADGNTKIQVEESANENIIRFTTNGIQAAEIDSNQHMAIGSVADNNVYLKVKNPANTTSTYGSGKTAIYGYREGIEGAANGGTGWGVEQIDAAVKGYSYWGNNYTAGVAGYNYADYANSAAVLGFISGGQGSDVWGGLGFKDSTDNLWGLYTGNNAYLGSLNINGEYDFPTSDGAANQVLTTDGSGTVSWATVSGVSGTGTTNRLARWSTATTLADATIQDDGTTVGINTAPSTFRMLNTSINSGTITTAIYGEHTLSTSATTRGVVGTSASTDINNSAGVYGSANNGAMAIYGQSGSNLANTIVISGYNSAGGTNQNFGVKGQTSSSNATSAGIYGFAFHGGNAVLAESNARVIQANAYGSRTAGYNAVEINNNASSTTASITRYGLNIQSTGSWTGAGAKNVGLLVNATGGTTNYAALFNGGYVGILNSDPTSALDVAGSVEVGDADAFYMGDPTTDGTWRIVRSGTALEFQRRESGTWVYKMQINP